MLPPGQIKVAHITEAPGKMTDSHEGIFIHTGGWLFVHDNNSIEVNLLEAAEKENMVWEHLDKSTETETDSAAGRVAAQL